jgi:hypothetical protein
MKPTNSAQIYFINVAFETTIKTDNYDDKVKQIIDEVNKINNGEVMITKIEGKRSSTIMA